MALFRIDHKSLFAVPPTTFHEVNMLERTHLQPLFERNLAVIAPDCMLLTAEFDEWTDSRRRIDLLALSKDAEPVIVELKRTSDDKYVELQALTYAAMASSMTFDQAVEIHAKYLLRNGVEGDARSIILKFLEWPEPQEDKFAQDAQIIIAARDFDRDVTSTVLWLRERDINIRCLRLTPYSLDGAVLLDVEVIIPLPEAEEYQQSIRVKLREERVHQNARKRGHFVFHSSDAILAGLTGKALALAVIRWALNSRQAQPNEVEELVRLSFNRGDLWIFLPDADSGPDEVLEELNRRRFATGKVAAYEPERWFHSPTDLIRAVSGVFALSTQWEVDAAVKAAEGLIARFGTGAERVEDGRTAR
jgi:hypothetical protein